MEDGIPGGLQHHHKTCCKKGDHHGRQACMRSDVIQHIQHMLTSFLTHGHLG